MLRCDINLVGSHHSLCLWIASFNDVNRLTIENHVDNENVCLCQILPLLIIDPMLITKTLFACHTLPLIIMYRSYVDNENICLCQILPLIIMYRSYAKVLRAAK